MNYLGPNLEYLQYTVFIHSVAIFVPVNDWVCFDHAIRFTPRSENVFAVVWNCVRFAIWYEKQSGICSYQ